MRLPKHEAKFPTVGTRMVILLLQLTFVLKKFVQFCPWQRVRFPRGKMLEKVPRKVEKNDPIIGPKTLSTPVGVPVLKMPVRTHLRSLVSPGTMLVGLQMSTTPPRQLLMLNTSLTAKFAQLVETEAAGAKAATTTRKAKQ